MSDGPPTGVMPTGGDDERFADDARRYRLERVEIDADEVYGRVAHLAEAGHVILAPAPREDAPVHSRVQGLDAPVEDLRLAGGLGYIGDIQPHLPERACGPAGGQQLPAHTREGLSEACDA